MQPLRRVTSQLAGHEQLLSTITTGHRNFFKLSLLLSHSITGDANKWHSNLHINYQSSRSVAIAAKNGQHDDRSDQGSNNNKRPNFFYTTIFGTAGLVSLAAYKKLHAFRSDKKQQTGLNEDDKHNELVRGKEQPTHQNGEERIFSRKEVAEHDSLDKGVWITYKGNVYDITKFIQHHPGGSHTIMMGAGGDVEPFWQTYTVHHAGEVQGLLSQYKIGVLNLEDRLKAQEEVKMDGNNPYANDPKRNPLLHVHTQQPFNAETPPKLLTPTYLTPTDIFFVRNHLPVPEVDLKDYRLSVCMGTDGDPDNLKELASFTLEELKTKFKAYSVDSVIQCSGNRRSDLKKLKEIKGLDWKVGAIGNARWTGVRLIDLLEHLGLSGGQTLHKNDFFERNGIKHVQLEGLDCDMTGQSYGASVSSDFALDPNKNVILAYEMNGQPLSRDHGFPLRFVAPGVTGARNVKWLSKIILSHEESNSHWQRKDYKSFSPNVDMFNLDFDSSVSIQETPVQSAICDPADGQEILLNLNMAGPDNTDHGAPSKEQSSKKMATIPVRGYAYSGGGKMIVRVDVSTDGGSTWQTASLDDVPKDAKGHPDFSQRNKSYSWTRWSIDISVPEHMLPKLNDGGGGQLEILCRAFDSSYNSQPERAETVWNVRGVVNNSWHRIKLKLKVEPAGPVADAA